MKSMLTFVKAVQSSDGKKFDTIEDAQAHELELLCFHLPKTGEESEIIKTVCAALVKERDKTVDILTTKEGSLVRARKVNGGSKKRVVKPPLTPAGSAA